MSRISLVQLAGSVRTFNLNRPFICPILLEVVDMMDAKEKSDWSQLMQSVGGEIFVTTRLSRPINIHKHQPPYAYVLGEKSV